MICKNIIPQGIVKNPGFRVKITVIAPNKEAYWNVAAVRLIAEPELLKTHAEHIFFPLEKSMRQHLPSTPPNTPDHILEFIQAKVMSVDSHANVLTYLKLNDSGTSNNGNDFFCHTVSYDKLILATGASSSSPAFKLNGSSELTKAALRELQQSTKNASSICIVGAGGVGVELAGELGYKYGFQKKILLYSAFDGTLERLKHRIADEAIHKLKNLGVETVTNARAISAYKEKKPIVGTRINTTSLASQPESDEALQPPLSPTFGEDLESRHTRFSLPAPKKPFLRSKFSHDNLSLRTMSTNTTTPSSPLRNNSASSGRSVTSDSSSVISASSNPRTVVAFENGYKESFDCYIPTTGNIPNSSYLPHSCLDNNGYVITDPYLRMAHNNPHRNIYVYGDLVSGGSQTIADLSDNQKQTFRATLLHDVLGPANDSESGEYPLRRYKPSSITYYVPISRKGGVGQTIHGFQIPGFVVSLVKGKHFRLNESKNFLLK
ncbi:hypothetical protein DV451_001935 [Geotrichum candidum]|uniref:FAD/NAD(P)-binding domain-containing protein n=1 Tax=Geotrichum candidum TaxID=1173061 RepID=A0A9P5G6S3_GEOCN|nr:hypothetical protein DV451_001935 [Geotrichum candidum]KAF5111192.1 hypothetical protein DV453_000433 [Geotrichum candidum]